MLVPHRTEIYVILFVECPPSPPPEKRTRERRLIKPKLSSDFIYDSIKIVDRFKKNETDDLRLVSNKNKIYIS